MNLEFLLGILSWGPWTAAHHRNSALSTLFAQEGLDRQRTAGVQERQQSHCSDSPALYDRPTDRTALPKAVHALSSTGFSHVHRFSQGGLEREAKDGKNGLLKGSSVAFSSEGMGQPIQRMAI